MKLLKKLNEPYNNDNNNNGTDNTYIASSSALTVDNQPTTTDQANHVAEAFVRSIVTTDTTEHLQFNDNQRVQNVQLIWLDSTVDKNSADYKNTVQQLRQTVNDVKLFCDGEQCVSFINGIKDIKTCIIVSGFLGRDIVPHIHSMLQVDSIFIFCGDKAYHEEWAKDWPKIRGIFTDISSICEALKQTAKQCEQDSISISFVSTGKSGDVTNKDLDKLDPKFMYTRILKEILLTIDFKQEHIQIYIDYCSIVLADNVSQLRELDKFQSEYHTKTPIWWYTWESFLYPMLNRCLRMMDMDILIKMGFFITDLHRHIEQLYTQQFRDNESSQMFEVYRGQGMSIVDFNQMNDTQGGLMSFNNFLSTSKTRQTSLRFARRALSSADMVGILFVMTIDPARSTTPFASIADVGFYGDKEGEILFSMHTIFSVDNITPMDENPRLLQVNLTLTNDNDNNLRVLTDYIRKESYPDSEGRFRLGLLLLKVGASANAQQVYEILLEQTTDVAEKSHIFHQLGCTKFDQGQYEEAITYYEKALEIWKQSLPSNHPNLAASYNNIGRGYVHMSDYSKALSYYEKALEIWKQSLPSNHPDLAASYNNIGSVYGNMSDYPKAVSFSKKALEILKQSLPSNHPDLATSYNNIASVYRNMGDYPKALSYYGKALEIWKQSLPSNHPALAGSYNNIGWMYVHMSDYSKALSYYEKALEIREQSLPSNHPDLAASYNNIGLVYGTMGNYPKALSFSEKALEIQQQMLSPSDPILGNAYNNVAWNYCKAGNYLKALIYAEKAVEIQEQVLPANDPDLGDSYDTLGLIHCKLCDYSKALVFCEKAIEIEEQALPANHPCFCTLYTNIGEVWEKMDDYSKAHSFYERALKIGQQSLPENHPDLSDCITNLDRIKKKL